MIEILTVDPRARHIEGLELATLKLFSRDDPRRPWRCLVVSKPKGGTARTTVKVVSR